MIVPLELQNIITLYLYNLKDVINMYNLSKKHQEYIYIVNLYNRNKNDLMKLSQKIIEQPKFKHIEKLNMDDNDKIYNLNHLKNTLRVLKCDWSGNLNIVDSLTNSVSLIKTIFYGTLFGLVISILYHVTINAILTHTGPNIYVEFYIATSYILFITAICNLKANKNFKMNTISDNGIVDLKLRKLSAGLNWKITPEMRKHVRQNQLLINQ